MSNGTIYAIWILSWALIIVFTASIEWLLHRLVGPGLGRTLLDCVVVGIAFALFRVSRDDLRKRVRVAPQPTAAGNQSEASGQDA